MTSYTLKNDKLELTVLQLGATVNSLKFLGKETVLRYETEEEYLAGSSFLGAAIGRYGNRIGNARFTLDGKEIVLTPNEGVNQLHGGPDSYDRRRWTVEKADDSEIRLSILSPDGDNGFPGNLKMTVTYTLVDNALRIVFEGVTDAPTVFAPTLHPYFAYQKEASMQINAKAHLEVDAGLIPSGVLLPCTDKFDFSEMKKLDLSFDDAFVLDGEHALTYKTEDYTMEMWTEFPAAQVYSGKFGGVAIEPEAYPDSPNHENFPGTVLRPGETFRKYAEYRFFEN